MESETLWKRGLEGSVLALLTHKSQQKCISDLSYPARALFWEQVGETDLFGDIQRLCFTSSADKTLNPHLLGSYRWLKEEYGQESDGVVAVEDARLEAVDFIHAPHHFHHFNPCFSLPFEPKEDEILIPLLTSFASLSK